VVSRSRGIVLRGRYLNSGTEAAGMQVFLTFLIRPYSPNVCAGEEMSANYKFYAQKMADRREAWNRGPLRAQLEELLRAVKRCEAMWALEERVERSL
jgi:hypothetical protein